MNNVSLTGRLTADPEVAKSTTGVTVLGFTVAVNRQFKKEGGQQADFIRCIAWRQTAEFIARYFKKGTKMEITGSLQSREFTDKDTGKKRTIIEVLVEKVDFAESKSNNNSANNITYSTPAPAPMTVSAPVQQPMATPTTMPGLNPPMPNPVIPMPQNPAAPVQQQPYNGQGYTNQNGFGGDLPALDSDGFMIMSDDGDLPF